MVKSVYKGKRWVLFFLLIQSLLKADAQSYPSEIYGDVTDKLGLKIATNGFGLHYRHTAPFRGPLTRVLDIDLTSLRHPREKDIINNRLANTRPYIYHKVNKVYSLRMLVGGQHILAGRNTKNSVGIAVFGGLGPSLNFIKPVYLDVQSADPNNPTGYLITSRRYQPEIINPVYVIGYSSYFTGIGETKIHPGISFKTGAEFSWGSYGSDYKAIEVGVTVDYMPSKPVIIFKEKNKAFFSGFYISFAIGKNQ